MSQLLRRIAPLALAGLVLVGLVPVAHASGDLTISGAEKLEVELLNKQRAALGVVGAKVDSRLTAIARARSQDMADKDYFAHQQPDGKWAWDLMTAAGITWYGAGEILAWNMSGTLQESAEGAAQQWRNSPTHYAVLKDPNFNYVGVAVVVDGSKKIWTAIFMKGPDRTGGWAKMGTATLGLTSLKTLSTGGTVSTRSVTFNWTGGDIKLSVLTSGFRDFQLQKRINSGSWQTLTSSTTAKSRTITLTRGNTYYFRARARDRNGNWGTWSAALQVRP